MTDEMLSGMEGGKRFSINWLESLFCSFSFEAAFSSFIAAVILNVLILPSLISISQLLHFFFLVKPLWFSFPREYVVMP